MLTSSRWRLFCAIFAIVIILNIVGTFFFYDTYSQPLFTDGNTTILGLPPFFIMHTFWGVSRRTLFFPDALLANLLWMTALSTLASELLYRKLRRRSRQPDYPGTSLT